MGVNPEVLLPGRLLRLGSFTAKQRAAFAGQLRALYEGLDQLEGLQPLPLHTILDALAPGRPATDTRKRVPGAGPAGCASRSTQGLPVLESGDRPPSSPSSNPVLEVVEIVLQAFEVFFDRSPLYPSGNADCNADQTGQAHKQPRVHRRLLRVTPARYRRYRL